MIGKVHSGLNQSKDILSDRDHSLDAIPEVEITPELESQGVVFVKRFPKTRNDLIEPTNTYLLTLGMPKLPTNIKAGLYQMKMVCLYQTRYIALNFSGLVTVKIHVELIKLASGVVKRGMTAKAAKKIRSVKIVKVITCHPQSNLPAGKKKKKF